MSDFNERGEFMKAIADALSIASQNIQKYRKEKDPERLRYWIEIHRQFVHACASTQQITRKFDSGGLNE